MASFCCSAVERPGLLGQLMLATVATHAARNSRAALKEAGVFSTFITDLDVEHAFSNRIKKNRIGVVKILLSIGSIKDGIYLKFLGLQVFEN